jgi:hypothetical protein
MSHRDSERTRGSGAAWTAATLACLLACRRGPSAADAGPTDARAPTESGVAEGAARQSNATAGSDEDGAAARARDGGSPSDAVSMDAVGARRGRIARLADDPDLAANAALLRKHFGAPFPRSLVIESVRLEAAGRRALLVGDAVKVGAVGFGQADPLLLVVDDKHALLWSKERPIAGITAPVAGVSLAAGPRGRVVVAACDPPTSTVALRVWDDDGAPFADFVPLSGSACSDVSVLYWPRHGWVLAVPRDKGTVAQRVSESGALMWGSGMEIAARSGAPVSLAADTRGSFIAVQAARPLGDGGASDHVLAFRYDSRGAPLWAAPADLGGVPASAKDRRFVVERPLHGLVRVTLGPASGRAAAIRVDVASSGEILRVPARAAPR